MPKQVPGSPNDADWVDAMSLPGRPVQTDRPARDAPELFTPRVALLVIALYHWGFGQ
jgi:hypothetical protein